MVRDFALRVKPPEVGVVDHARGVTDPFLTLAHGRTQQSLGRPQRHLRVVGDRPLHPVRPVEVGDAALAIARADLAEREELDGRAERVGDGPAEEAAAELRAEGRGGGVRGR